MILHEKGYLHEVCDLIHIQPYYYYITDEEMENSMWHSLSEAELGLEALVASMDLALTTILTYFIHSTQLLPVVSHISKPTSWRKKPGRPKLISSSPALQQAADFSNCLASPSF